VPDDGFAVGVDLGIGESETRYALIRDGQIVHVPAGDDALACEGAPTERAPAPPFPLDAARASLTELALRAGIAVTP
jgi:hypothetical protein